MMIDGLIRTGLRVAYRGARLGIDTAQASLDLAKAVIGMLDPDDGGGKDTHDRVSHLLEALEALVGLVGADRPLGEALRPGGAIDRLFSPGGLIDRLSSADGLNTVIKEAVSPELTHLYEIVNELRQVAENLNAAATPLGRVAARVPKFLRKPLPYEMAQREEPSVRPYLAEEPAPPVASPQITQLRDDGHALVNPRLPVNGHSNGNGLRG